METPEVPRIGNRNDALELLDRLIEIAMTGVETGKALTLGLEALKDVIEREVI
jgi:hypothetical protein